MRMGFLLKRGKPEARQLAADLARLLAMRGCPLVALPDDADPTKVDAQMSEGVLHIKVAKRESSKPRRITVN